MKLTRIYSFIYVTYKYSNSQNSVPYIFGQTLRLKSVDSNMAVESSQHAAADESM